jgi:hypothetical protein
MHSSKIEMLVLPAFESGVLEAERCEIRVGESGLEMHQIPVWMDSRRFDGLGEIAGVSEHVQNHLYERRSDSIRPPGTQRRPGSRMIQHHGTHHRGQRSSGLHVSDAVGIDVFLSQHVVEVDPGSRDQNSRSLAVAGRYARGHSLAIDHADVRGAPA